jgi:hypothetical protein
VGQVAPFSGYPPLNFVTNKTKPTQISHIENIQIMVETQGSMHYLSRLSGFFFINLIPVTNKSVKIAVT